jgi:hypothetical protein
MNLSLTRMACALTLLSFAMGASIGAAAAKEKGKTYARTKTQQEIQARENWSSFSKSAPSSSCQSFYDKYKATGAGFWLGRYHACKHGW